MYVSELDVETMGKKEPVNKLKSFPGTMLPQRRQHGSAEAPVENDYTHTVTEKRITVAKRHIPATIASFVLQGGSAEASVENDATRAVAEKRVTVAKRRRIQTPSAKSSKTDDCQCIVCSEWYSASVSVDYVFTVQEMGA